MDSAQAAQVIHQVLKQIQSNQQLECPTLTDTIRPIKDLKKFDSPVSLAATGIIARRLGLTIDPKVNFFGDKKGVYSIGQSVALVCKLAGEKKSKEPAKV